MALQLPPLQLGYFMKQFLLPIMSCFYLQIPHKNSLASGIKYNLVQKINVTENNPGL